ncbi:phage tail protein I [uncultured Sphingomonas sp.]|uniref:phage tail protein I n=1 Tax=uncultured Sphingomonas sp. TaxID=158754 RepID=UPI0025D005D2|nr:phage tail protein I [uncultured Sphingomonas sp.]
MMNSLLPPNATLLERALEAGVRLPPEIDAMALADAIDDPAKAPAILLPWLAWGYSVDAWDADWSEAAKRAAIADSINLHRLKGTRASVETVLSRFDGLARLVEWHEAVPRAAPHTFEIYLPIAGERASAGGQRATAAFADAIIREIRRVKPLREHFRLVQSIDSVARVGIQAAVRVVAFDRDAYRAADDRSQPWEAFLQSEDGEPVQGPDGAFWDTTP